MGTTKRKNDYKVTGWEATSIPGIEVPLKRAVTAERREAVPAVQPGYVFREEHVRELSTCIWPSDGGEPLPVLLSGPKGSGKTSLVMQMAAICNIPVYRVNLNVGTSVRHLKGRMGALNGSTVFIPGVATLAMEHGAWLLLDELSGATPPVALSLFPILEPGGEVLLEDAQPPRYVRRHPDFRVFATDNTIGAQMENARFSYRGTNPDQNAALVDRFGGMCEVGYLQAEAEYTAVSAIVPKIDHMVLEGLVVVANAVRSSDDLPAFSTRMLVNWARRIAMGRIDSRGRQLLAGPDYQLDGNWVLDCAQGAFLRKQRTMAEKTAIEEVIRRTFSVS